MANRWKGNIIAATATTSSGTNFTGKANGSWGLNSQLQQKQANLWAKGQTIPNTPTSVTATDGNAQSIVSFTAPTDNGGSAITSYTVTSSTGGITATGSASPITVTGLTNGTAYTFTVTATNGVGTSIASYPSNSVTPSAGPTIGDAFQGGYYAGKINVSGTQYYLIVAPKASGESTGRNWGTYGVTTGITSVINGPTNSASLAALGAAYQAAVFCEGLTIGGYTDWYLPAKNELEVLYYYLKPTTSLNNTSSGSNANAVSPEPISTNYTSGSPAQTSAGIGFRTGETNAFASDFYWSSTENNSSNAWIQYFYSGEQANDFRKNQNFYVRAVRRIAV
jgi:hypothetical protein